MAITALALSEQEEMGQTCMTCKAYVHTKWSFRLTFDTGYIMKLRWNRKTVTFQFVISGGWCNVILVRKMGRRFPARETGCSHVGPHLQIGEHPAFSLEGDRELLRAMTPGQRYSHGGCSVCTAWNHCYPIGKQWEIILVTSKTDYGFQWRYTCHTINTTLK